MTSVFVSDAQCLRLVKVQLQCEMKAGALSADSELKGSLGLSVSLSVSLSRRLRV